MLGLDRKAARYAWTVVFILLLVRLVYLIRETLLIFVVALLFAYLLWPLVNLLDRRLPGRSKVLALTLVYLALVGFLIVFGIAVGSRVVQQANALATKLPGPPRPFPFSRAPPELCPRIHRRRPRSSPQCNNNWHITRKDLLAMLPNAALGVIARAGSLIFIVLVPILSFFFLKDGKEMRDSILGSLSAGGAGMQWKESPRTCTCC